MGTATKNITAIFDGSASTNTAIFQAENATIYQSFARIKV